MSSTVLAVPGDVVGAAGLRADVVLTEDPAGGQDEREAAVAALVGRHERRLHEPALAAHELADVHDRRAERGRLVARPLDAEPTRSSRSNETPENVGVSRRDLVHDLRRSGRSASGSPSRVAIRQTTSHSCLPFLRRHHRADPVDPPLGVGERAVLLQERGAGQEHVGELRGLVEEQVLDDDAAPSRRSAARTWWVFGSDCAMSSPWTNSALNVPSIAASNMFGMRRPGSASSGVPHSRLEDAADRVVRDVAVAGELVREGAHVAGALHVVLAAQRVDADAVAADVAGRHRQVGHRPSPSSSPGCAR